MPCPFCDAQPEVLDNFDEGQQKEKLGFGTITCENDICGVNPSVDYYNGFEQGKYVWNTRAPLTAPLPEDRQRALSAIDYLKTVAIECEKAIGVMEWYAVEGRTKTLISAAKDLFGDADTIRAALTQPAAPSVDVEGLKITARGEQND